MGQHQDILQAYLESKYPAYVTGVNEARAVNPERFGALAERFLGWALKARGEGGIEKAVDAFVGFTTDVNLAQARYEQDGHYEHSSYQELYEKHYSQHSEMDGYLWGIYLTNFLWAHHMKLSLDFESRFLKQIRSDSKILEIAPGHGGWGVWALDTLPEATLNGYDISPSSMEIAASVAEAAGVASRTTYEEKDALTLDPDDDEKFDACICCFLIEHLENPQRLMEVVSGRLKDDGTAYLTGALTAAQVDHIYEFKRESELVLMAEKAGLRVLETHSVHPARLFPGAKYVPRSMSLTMIKEHRGPDG